MVKVDEKTKVKTVGVGSLYRFPPRFLRRIFISSGEVKVKSVDIYCIDKVMVAALILASSALCLM